MTPNLGVAMIVKNGAATMERALEPFLGITSEVSIVLGGQSEDATAAIAESYATQLNLYPGDKFNFSRARQMAYDALTTEWVITVDADDIWQGVDNIAGVIDKAEDNKCVKVGFNYDLGDSVFVQDRLHKRAYGQWIGPVHEFWQAFDKKQVTLMSDKLSIRQQRDGDGRGRQNIDIAKAWLTEHPDDLRTMAHLARDYEAAGEHGAAIDVGLNYIKEFEAQKPQKRTEELFHTYYTIGIARLNQGQYDAAIIIMSNALGIKNCGVGWVTLANAYYNKATAGQDKNGLYELAIMCADKALQMGKTRSQWPFPTTNYTSSPYFLKGLSLKAMGRKREAIAAFDIGLHMEDDEKMRLHHRELCVDLQIVP